MGYYFKHDYNFSYHGIQRCKERLNLKDKTDFEVKDEVMKLIKKSTKSFETEYEIYLSAGNTDLYFVINKSSKLIITATNISVEKQLRMISKGNY
ncbi:hypothetical protein ESOMN_v1c03810 [Williamsoniiplasma somnilux]|uniref:DUF4258 domain-containing protein n=1 Tax=Williamsoniiplasma somnilux TaxID=215578 RepID=A0A2K8P1I3_9MOLU|nr:hypothetical protein [Williamsoniiplasma somnilux]ATZ18763.1 hypothetical protein ESOMN_v1c03810 [Williamsoniiplasma somnilux]